MQNLHILEALKSGNTRNSGESAQWTFMDKNRQAWTSVERAGREAWITGSNKVNSDELTDPVMTTCGLSGWTFWMTWLRKPLL